MDINEKVYVTRDGKVVYRRSSALARGEELIKVISRAEKAKVAKANKEEESEQRQEVKEMTYSELREAQVRKYTHRRFKDKSYVKTKAGQKIILNPDKTEI